MIDSYYHQVEAKLALFLDSLRDKGSRDLLGLVKGPRKPWKKQNKRIQEQKENEEEMEYQSKRKSERVKPALYHLEFHDFKKKEKNMIVWARKKKDYYGRNETIFSFFLFHYQDSYIDNVLYILKGKEKLGLWNKVHKKDTSPIT